MQIFLIYAFILGAAIGSFFNVLIYRIPRRESIAWPPSHCPNCDRRIKWYENIPLVSYIALRGKCAGCKQHISLQYPIVEFIFAVVFTVVVYVVLQNYF